MHCNLNRSHATTTHYIQCRYGLENTCTWLVIIGTLSDIITINFSLYFHKSSTCEYILYTLIQVVNTET